MTFAFVGGWLWLSLLQHGHRHAFFAIKAISSTVGVIGFSFFSLSLFLSSRLKVLENLFGGLDQIYRIHHRLGLLGFYFILAHPFIEAFKWFPQGRFFWFVFPLHHRTAVNLGSIAFWLMVVIIVFTFIKLLPYDKWKIVHKLMAVVFILASLHFLLSNRRFGHAIAPLILLLVPVALGLFGIVYKQIYLAFLSKRPTYVVTKVSKMTDNVVMITFKPEGKSIQFIPGQYAFFSFGGKLPREQHPFTACDLYDSTFSILAKARGDFTRKLYDTIDLGMRAHLEGPYGRFDYRRGGKDQIWIAGGVGIVPFLAWSDSLADWPGKCVLFYCVHRNEDTVFAQTFRQIKAVQANFDFHLYCTEKKQRLTVQHIQQSEGNLEDKEIFMCGPRRLTHPFVKALTQAGVKRYNIHFEDFEFF